MAAEGHRVTQRVILVPQSVPSVYARLHQQLLSSYKAVKPSLPLLEHSECIPESRSFYRSSAECAEYSCQFDEMRARQRPTEDHHCIISHS